MQTILSVETWGLVLYLDEMSPCWISAFSSSPLTMRMEVRAFRGDYCSIWRFFDLLSICRWYYINVLYFCFHWLAMSNSCLNPIICGIYNVSTYIAYCVTETQITRSMLTSVFIFGNRFAIIQWNSKNPVSLRQLEYNNWNNKINIFTPSVSRNIITTI